MDLRTFCVSRTTTTWQLVSGSERFVFAPIDICKRVTNMEFLGNLMASSSFDVTVY